MNPALKLKTGQAHCSVVKESCFFPLREKYLTVFSGSFFGNSHLSRKGEPGSLRTA